MIEKKEKGEVMIEGMMVMIITIIVLIWLLALGFLHYQRTTLTIVANDVATKIASSYHNPSSDPVMGYVSNTDLAQRDIYRDDASSYLHSINENKAQKYAEYMLNRTNFVGTIQSVNTDVEYIKDSQLRQHIKVTVKCTFHTPFSFDSKLIPFNGNVTYTASARRDCTELSDYASTTDFLAHYIGGEDVDSKIVDLIKTLIGIFNHNYNKVE